MRLQATNPLIGSKPNGRVTSSGLPASSQSDSPSRTSSNSSDSLSGVESSFSGERKATQLSLHFEKILKRRLHL